MLKRDWVINDKLCYERDTDTDPGLASYLVDVAYNYPGPC